MTRLLATGTLVIAVHGWLGALGPAGERPVAFLGLYAAAFALYLLGWNLVRAEVRIGRGRGRGIGLVILAVGLLARVAALPMPVSDDVYRYLWEGRLQALGGNPYLVAPSSGAAYLPPGASADPYRGRVNHPELTTIYPPLAELAFRAVTAVRYSALAWKLFVLIGEAALVSGLLGLLRCRGRPASEILLYLWNPLPVIAFAGEGHVDALMLAAAWLGILALSGERRILAGLGWGASIAAKVISAAYLPLFLRRGGVRAILAAFLLLLALALPYRAAGFGLIEVLLRFGHRMPHNGSLQPLLAGALGNDAALAVAAALYLALLGWTWRRDPDPIEGGLDLTGGFLLLSPSVHPWYVTWVVPFLVFRRSGMWVLFSGTVGLAYAAYGFRALTGTFHLPLWLRCLEYAPVYLWGAFELVRGRSARRARLSRPAS